MSAQTDVYIEEIEGSVYSAKIEVANHEFIVDEPLSFEGAGDLGPSPFDLLTSSLAACTIMTMRWYAQNKGLPLERAEADVTYDQKKKHFVKVIALHGDKLTEADREKLIEMAAKCPVHKVLTGEITIETCLEPVS